MKKTFLLTTASILLFVIILSGCQERILPSLVPTEIFSKLETKNPQIRGNIIEISKKDNKVIGLYIVGKKEADTTYDKALVGITDKTEILIMENAKYKILTSSDLKTGQNVAVLFTGPIGTSDPVQASADEILILQ
jgi:hypothetical protein